MLPHRGYASASAAKPITSGLPYVTHAAFPTPRPAISLDYFSLATSFHFLDHTRYQRVRPGIYDVWPALVRNEIAPENRHGPSGVFIRNTYPSDFGPLVTLPLPP